MVYLIHFDEKFKHAQHYIGFVESKLDKREARHRSGNGAKLLRAVTKAGIGWKIVRVWEDGSRDFERSLKNKKNSKHLCPVCNTKKTDDENKKSDSSKGVTPRVRRKIQPSSK